MSTESEENPGPDEPGTAENGAAEPGAAETGAAETVDVRIRRAPKVGIFLIVGAMLGLLAALVLTSVFEVDPNVGFTGTFAYLALYSIPLGIALASLVGLLFDRVSKRRATTMRARVTERRPALGDSDGASVDDDPDQRDPDAVDSGEITS
ncbi:MAG: hypothetical protein KF680_09905 [Cryobacterium sp.]|nr:hypothetical protein [Cryobacterium sp.]